MFQVTKVFKYENNYNLLYTQNNENFNLIIHIGKHIIYPYLTRNMTRVLQTNIFF